MDITLTWYLGAGPLLGWLLWWWNDLWFAYRIKRGCSASGTELPPGHMGLPIFGEMLSFLWYFKVLRRPDDYIKAKLNKYGKGVGLYRTHLFGSPAIIACSPSINKFVFQSDDVFHPEWPAIEIVGSTSIVAVQGESHARLRSFVSTAINQPDALRRIAHMVQPRLIEALRSWAHKGRVVAYTETKKVTFGNIGKLFAGLERGPVVDTLDELFTGLVKGFRSYPIDIPGSDYHHALQCRKRAVGIFREELERRKKKPEEATKRNDMMDGLMQLKDEQGRHLSEIEVLDNIVSLVVAGYESTSLSMMWALYYLAKYPNVLQKLREENMLFSKTKNGEFITSDEVSELKYTKQVVEETIRLANVAALVFRRATKDVVYKGVLDVSVSGMPVEELIGLFNAIQPISSAEAFENHRYTIPKNWKVMLWIRYLHTDPENFEDPMCFNPERWNKPAKPGTYLVFGGGSRICIGNMLARLQLTILLHHLAVGYKWELVNPNAKMSYLSHPKPVDGAEIVFSKL